MLFASDVKITRIRQGKRQAFEMLISEEALLLAKFLRNELKGWNPRIPSLRVEVEGKEERTYY